MAGDDMCRFGKVLFEVIVQERDRDASQSTQWVNMELSREKPAFEQNHYRASSFYVTSLGNCRALWRVPVSPCLLWRQN